MGLFQAYKMAYKSICTNKVRSFLTMLGVIIGVASVITSVAFAQGSTKKITDSIENLGTNLIMINITGDSRNSNVTLDDFKEFSRHINEKIVAVVPSVSGSVKVKEGQKAKQISIVGTSSEYAIAKDTRLQRGRFILPIDIEYRQKVAVISNTLAKEVFGEDNPVGKDIKLNGYVFEVIGVFEQKSTGEYFSSQNQIILPVNTAQRLLQTSKVKDFTVMVENPDTIIKTTNMLKAYLTEKLGNPRAFDIYSNKEMLNTLNSVTDNMMLVLAGIATISLIVGGIGIMNIMFVSVTERTKEIGIRKALGAKRKIILTQFLIEALMVTGIGGIMGITSGVGIIKFIVSSYVPEVYSMQWMLLSFGISIFIGVVFGMFPAFKAAKLNPIDALKFE